MRYPFALVAVAAVLTLAGCGGGDPELPTVGGSTYIDHIVESVDQMRVDRDCDAMQRAFEAADRDSHSDLMEYIDTSMKFAGCYGDDPVSLTEDGCLVDPAERTADQRDYAEAMGCD